MKDFNQQKKHSLSQEKYLPGAGIYLFIFLFILIGLFFAKQRMDALQLEKEIHLRKDQNEKSYIELERLKLEIAHLTSLDRVKKKAKKLGLIEPTEDQIFYLK